MYRVDTSLYLYYQFEYFAFSSIVQTFGLVFRAGWNQNYLNFGSYLPVSTNWSTDKWRAAQLQASTASSYQQSRNICMYIQMYVTPDEESSLINAV